MLETYWSHLQFTSQKENTEKSSDRVLWVPVEQFPNLEGSCKEQSMRGRVLYEWINQLPTHAT